MGGPYLAPGAAGTFYRITQHRSRNTCARFAPRTRLVTISRVKTRAGRNSRGKFRTGGAGG